MRISVVGTSGSGKTTTARRAAAGLDVPFVELDAIHHQAGWVPLPAADLRARVAEVVAGAAWVVDGNYGAVRDLVWGRATTIVWVDPPRGVVMAQVVSRSIVRLVTRRELWNGNRERWSNVLDADHPVRWAWSTFPRRREEFEEQLDGRWVRLRSRRAARRWLASLHDDVGVGP